MDLKNIFENDRKLLIKAIAALIIIVVSIGFCIVKEVREKNELQISQIENSNLSESLYGENIPESSSDSSISTEEQPQNIIVDVAGAVKNPSIVKLKQGSRVYQAIEKAGGLNKDADLRTINRAEIVADGQKLYIPTFEEVEEALNTSSENGEVSNINLNMVGESSVLKSDSIANPNQSKININTADSVSLQTLTGIGPKAAEKIISYRNENGGFKSIDEIKNVNGIGDKTFDKFKDKITV